jgi:hypothetical protein
MYIAIRTNRHGRFYSFFQMMDFTPSWGATVEPIDLPHDGFIASFGVMPTFPVSMLDIGEDPVQLQVRPLDGYQQWIVAYPDDNEWELVVLDAIGRIVQANVAQKARSVIDLGAQATGVYILRANSNAGTVVSVKIVKP